MAGRVKLKGKNILAKTKSGIIHPWLHLNSWHLQLFTTSKEGM